MWGQDASATAIIHRHLPYHTTPYHTIPYHTTPHHIISYHIIPYHTIPHHTVSHTAGVSDIAMRPMLRRPLDLLLQPDTLATDAVCRGDAEEPLLVRRAPDFPRIKGFHVCQHLRAQGKASTCPTMCVQWYGMVWYGMA